MATVFQGSIKCSIKIKCELRNYEDFLLHTTLTTLSDAMSIRISHLKPVKIHVSIFDIISMIQTF